MAKDDIRKELEELRAQLAALQAERESQVPAVDEALPEAGDASEPDEPAEGLAHELGADVAAQIQELMEVLDKEIKEANPTTMLVVFALGVLVGRLLPR
ncbi:MAG: hypothetical protein U9Q71_07055 [Pseudomonadota bacterium]|nr:hypothetical protein [Pseudomonadota bacterium]